jgi:acyl-CoA reductase-like NAD-dependent aldehyde dehydrogenase
VQLELFADVVLRGDHLEVVIDRADADARPIPRPDLRRMLVPLGPIAVFGASNFPFAFGVAGGDTAAGLAAGCPVIAKGHPSQPGVNDLVAGCVARAVAAAGLPDGTFASVQGAAPELGLALVDAEGVCAVAFTGSTAGGRALFDRAARRPRPIPVYAEMGSTNPAVVTRAALAARADAIGAALVTAITGAAGQLCTKPGVVLVPAGAEGDTFTDAVAAELRGAAPGVLLNERLRDAFVAGIDDLGEEDGVEVLTPGTGPASEGYAHTPAVFSVAARDCRGAAELREERFGPAVVLARYESEEDLLAGVAAFDGQLAGALFAEPEEDAPCSRT